MRTTLFLSLFLLSVFSLFAISDSPKDNKEMLDVLKESAMTVVDKNQKLFNTNKDGSITNKGIDKEWFAKQSYAQFKKMIAGEGISMKDLVGSTDQQQLARVLTGYLAAARIVIARGQDKINTDGDGSNNPKNFYPAVFGRLVADEFLSRTNIKIKQTTSGRGMGARNSHYNSPDAWEQKALAKIEAPGWVIKQGFGENVVEDGKKLYRFIMPLEIKTACLGCHGEPRGQKDISGHTKEGYKLHEVRGGISVTLAQ
ncbi:MAG: DUF3365 domain-containing protein [Deferribacteres bacterium]|nr:DUF3365 domain-containing protein [candidate division KSB1 bacterium]MCB9502419.1 DUF3365 domain-containing protein [Deferribacteres bacterium]